MQLTWMEEAWEEYLYWQTQDKKTLKKINLLLRPSPGTSPGAGFAPPLQAMATLVGLKPDLLLTDIQRNTFTGLGEPEPLKGNLSGWWSRRIDHKNRIVYRERDGRIIILACKGHYD